MINIYLILSTLITFPLHLPYSWDFFFPKQEGRWSIKRWLSHYCHNEHVYCSVVLVFWFIIKLWKLNTTTCRTDGHKIKMQMWQCAQLRSSSNRYVIVEIVIIFWKRMGPSGPVQNNTGLLLCLWMWCNVPCDNVENETSRISERLWQTECN